MVELVEVVEVFTFKLFGERTVRIFDAQRSHLSVVFVRSCLCADELSVGRYIDAGKGCGMQRSHATSFGDKSSEAVDHLRVNKQLSLDAVEEDCVVFLDLGVFEIVEVVAEGGDIGPGIFSDELEREVSIGNGGVIVTAVHA